MHAFADSYGANAFLSNIIIIIYLFYKTKPYYVIFVIFNEYTSVLGSINETEKYSIF